MLFYLTDVLAIAAVLRRTSGDPEATVRVGAGACRPAGACCPLPSVVRAAADDGTEDAQTGQPTIKQAGPRKELERHLSRAPRPPSALQGRALERLVTLPKRLVPNLRLAMFRHLAGRMPATQAAAATASLTTAPFVSDVPGTVAKPTGGAMGPQQPSILPYPRTLPLPRHRAPTAPKPAPGPAPLPTPEEGGAGPVEGAAGAPSREGLVERRTGKVGVETWSRRLAFVCLLPPTVGARRVRTARLLPPCQAGGRP